MRVRKVVQAEQEVSIEIGWEDIHEALVEAKEEMERDPERRNAVTCLLNYVAQVLKAVSDDQIKAMQSGPRDIVRLFLESQAKRYQ